MRDVRDKSRKEPESNTMIAQMKKLREIIRILRDDPIIKQESPEYPDVQSELGRLFPWLPTKLIEFALYVETNTSLLPMDLFQMWVSVPERYLRNLIANALLEDGSRTRLYSIVGLFLWSTLYGYKVSSGEEFTFVLKQMQYLYKSTGAGEVKIREHWDVLGFHRDVKKESFRGAIVSRTTIRIPKGSIFEQYVLTDAELKRIRFNSNNRIGLKIPDADDLLARFGGYTLLYPRDDYGEVHPIIPWIYYDSKMLRIPLTEGIVPQLIAALFPAEELGWLMNKYSTRNRNSRVRTILAAASTNIGATDDKLKRFNRISIQLPARHLDRRHDVLRVFTGMTHRGVSVDQKILRSIDLDSLDPKRHQIHYLKKERQAILDIVNKSKDNRLYSKYRFNAYSERVYTRNYSIQGLPGVFKPAIVPDEGFYFVYFDVVANDLTMLISLANDITGQNLLKEGIDPYLKIAELGFPSNPNRDQAKAFVNPWLYGATIPTIVAQSTTHVGAMTTKQAEVLKKTIPKVLPQSVEWLLRLRREIKVNGKIPSDMNGLERLEIPIPPNLAKKHGAVFLLQRFGISLFRNILCHAAQAGIEPVVFVHDSVLFQVPESIPPQQVMSEIQGAIHQAMLAKSLNVINVKMGYGDDWEYADLASQKRIISI